MKIAFLVASLRGGGAERVASTLCNHWASNGHQIVLITFDSPQNDFYKSDDRIKRYALDSYNTERNLRTMLSGNLRRLMRIRKILKKEKPDVMLSFMPVPNVQAILSCLFTGIPVIISERTYPPYFNDNDNFDRIRKFIYQFSSAFVAQTNIVAQWGANFLKHKKIAVIINPINAGALIESTDAMRTNTILSIGRLSADKGFDMLLQAFQKIHHNNPDWSLQIVGDGSERAKLEQQLKDLKISDRVQLVGQSNAPQSYYARAKIFVVSSRVEGFPNALIEAMANGLASVSFDCNSGPADIIVDGVNGLLVPANKVDGMAEALQRLISDAQLREKLAKEAVKIRDKCQLENISEKWLKLIACVSKQSA